MRASIPSRPYSQKIEAWLLAESGCHLIDFCRKFGYYSLAIKIMSLDETDEKKSKAIMAKDNELKNHYLRCAKDQMTIRRKGDNRSFTQYFKDLITGWIVEDLVLEMLREQGVDIVHNGRDTARRIAVGNDVSTKADFVVKVGNVTRSIEITNEYNTFLENEGYIEKRAPALFNLWKDKGIWLFRDLRLGKYILIDFATEKVKLHLRRHNAGRPNWSKDVHRYVLGENGKKIRDDRLLAAEIISVVGCGIDGKEQPQLEEVVDADSPPQDFDIGGIGRGMETKAVIPPSQNIGHSKDIMPGSVKQVTKNEIGKPVEPSSQKKKTTSANKTLPRQIQQTPVVEDDYDDGSDSDAEDWNGVDLGDGDFV